MGKDIELHLDSKELVSRMHILSQQIQKKMTETNRKMGQRLEKAPHRGGCPSANKHEKGLYLSGSCETKN